MNITVMTMPKPTNHLPLPFKPFFPLSTNRPVIETGALPISPDKPIAIEPVEIIPDCSITRTEYP